MYKQVEFLSKAHPLDDSRVQSVFTAARARGFETFLVGGALRDAIAPVDGKIVKDFDFAIKGDAIAFAREMTVSLGGHFVMLDESFGIARVAFDDGSCLDFAAYQGSIEDDLLRRDITMNALASDGLSRDQILDVTGGLDDLRDNLVRAVSEKSLLDDPLRLLRVYRFAAARGARVEDETRRLVALHCKTLDAIAAERVNYEIFTLMNSSRAGQYVHDMGAIGLMEAIFPELVDCRRVTANSYHHLGLFDHSLETVPQLEAKLAQMPDFITRDLASELSWGVSRLSATKVACVLHDIGKPDTWEILPDGRHTFIGHDKVGAALVKPLAQRAKWSRSLTRLVEKLVAWHLRPGQLFHTGEPTQKALNRFYRNVGDDFAELMLLAFADFCSTRGPGLTGANRDALDRSLHGLLMGYPQYIESIASLPKLLSGSDVMSLLSIEGGPRVGKILRALSEAQEFKEVTNRAQAEAFVLNYKEVK